MAPRDIAASIIKPISGMASALAQYGQRLFQPPKDVISGIDVDTWYSPLQPVKPIAPAGTEPRGFQYWAGQNLLWTPRPDAEYSSAQLKQLATYPLARICIEGVKDVLTRANWEVQLRPEPGETRKEAAKRAKGDANIKNITRFFEKPDREHMWDEWLRPLVEDMLVIDAPTILIRKKFNGQIAELPVLRGESIARYIDVNGWTPMPPEPAYAQIWWGIPLVNLATDQLVYKPRNIVPRNTISSQLYGMSPTEQLAPEIEIGIKRLEFVLAYYCYSDDTEVLTRRGWLRFAETNETDEFATRKINTREFEWQRSLEFFRKDYKGEMIHFKGQSLDLLVTPNHRMLVDSLPRKLKKGKPGKSQEQVITAEELMKGQTGRTHIPTVSVWAGVEIGSKVFPSLNPHEKAVKMTGDQYCAFMGAYLAEGSLSHKPYRINIHQPSGDSRGVNALYKKLLDEIFSAQTRVYNGPRGLGLCCVSVGRFLAQFGRSWEKFIPDDIREATPRQLEIFWKYYYAGDGRDTKQDGRTPQAFTVSKKLADQLTEILQKMGIASTTGFRPAGEGRIGNKKINGRAGYFISARKSKSSGNFKATQVEYEAPVTCVVVPNKFLYVRRNGKAAWCGNTEGSVPGVMQIVPKGTPPDKIAEAMGWMNSELAGNLAARRQIRLIQGWNEPGKPDQIVMTKEPLLADAFDDYHMKKIAFGYGVSPQRLTKTVNRASAQQQDAAAQLEGILPYFSWLKFSVMDYLIQVVMALPQYEWIPDPFTDPSFEKVSKAVNEAMNKPVMTINEARDRMGFEPRPEPEADMLGMTTSTGWLPLDVAIQQAKGIAGINPNAPPPAPDKPDKKPNGKIASRVVHREDSLESAERNATNFGFGAAVHDHKMVLGQVDVEKTSADETRRAVIHPGRSLPQSIKARHHMERVLVDQFKDMKRKTKRILAKALKLVKAEGDDAKRAEDDVLKALEANWKKIADETLPDYEAALLAGVGAGAVQLDLTDMVDIISKTNDLASEWAQKRSAELVGLKRLDDGALAPNPNAEWAISDTTREKLKEVITEVFEIPDVTLTDVEEAIRMAGIFDDQRATMIARTEISNAQVNANLMAWRESKLVQQVSWQLSLDHDHDDLCDELADGSPYDVDDVPTFPAHPNCLCALVLLTLVGEERK